MNKFLWKKKIRIEYWNVAISYFKKGDSWFDTIIMRFFTSMFNFHASVGILVMVLDIFYFKFCPLGWLQLLTFLLIALNQSSIMGVVVGFSLFCIQMMDGVVHGFF